MSRAILGTLSYDEINTLCYRYYDSEIVSGLEIVVNHPGGGGGGTPYNGLYVEAPPERGTFFRLQVCKRVGISQVELYKRVGKSVI